MSKTRNLVLLLCCTAFLTATFVSPALGGPSLGSVAKTATKALKLAKKANRKADLLSNYYQPVKTIQISQEATAPVGEFARFSVHCPSGFVPTGYGANYGALYPIAVVPDPTGYTGSMYNPSDSPQPFSGSVHVICVYGDYHSSATGSSTISRTDARRQVAQSERDYRGRTAER